MYCANCGSTVNEYAAVCLKCGVATKHFEGNYANNFSGPEGTFDWLTTLLLCFFLGTFGVHSFYTKKTTIGILQLITLGGCGIWALIDLILIIVGSFKDGNNNYLYRRQ